MGGPPIIIFLANQEWPKEVFRATVAFLFLITGTLSLFSHILTGVTTGDRMIIGLSLIPASIIGFYLGDAGLEFVEQSHGQVGHDFGMDRVDTILLAQRHGRVDHA